MWEQFEKKELDGRLHLIAGYLGCRDNIGSIVDLNCGIAPLTVGLRDRWLQYYGNDTNEVFIRRCWLNGYPRSIFEVCRDDEVMPRLYANNIQPEILLSLGYACRLNEHESQTLDRSIVSIAAQFRLHTVIVEAWAGLPKHCGLDGMLADLCRLGYKEAYAWKLEPITPTGDYQNRVIHIMGQP